MVKVVADKVKQGVDEGETDYLGGVGASGGVVGQEVLIIIAAALIGGYLVKKRKIWMLGAVLLIGAAVGTALFMDGGDGSADAYRTATVEKGNIKATVASTGKLAPLNTVEVGSQVSGNIKEIYVDYNSVVKNDQVITLIDPEIYAGQVNQAKAHLEKARVNLLKMRNETAAARADEQSARAQLFAARATFREAKLDYQRKVKLAKRKAIATSQLDSALARKDNAQGTVQMAEARLSTSQTQIEMALTMEKYASAEIAAREADLQLAKIKLNYCTIRSPIDGVVITRNVDVGQTVAATLQSPVLFTIAEDLSRMQVEVDVSEADVGQITRGQGVEFTVDAFQDKVFKAKIHQVRNSATTIQNVVTYKIVADVNNDSLLLRPGMTANVTIVLATVADALKVPNSALRFKPLGKIGETKVKKKLPITERPFYKKTIQALAMDPAQSRELAGIIARGEQQLKAAYSLPEDARDLPLAWRAFFRQVFTDTYNIIREDQREKFKAYWAQFKEAVKRRQRGHGRRATVYVAGDEGPMALPIRVGISNEIETQVVGGELQAGDKVIVGLALASDGSPKQSGNSIMNIFRRAQ
ncbi:MAG: efflux RND transporter periplasmic adaptor subunit [Desulfarculaceae bacterium]|nr:efflux RND transporter periplasmic adaptor subunit [Desulfarculaceae bacterium]MCF8124453.1 efflux RND transporter periplasmic adaptor subunit [Desulfarculaceae bacterium]